MIRRLALPPLALAILAVTALALLWAAAPAVAQTCGATVSNLDFGQISVRAGAVNTTSGTVTVSCSGGISPVVGTCLRFGAGQGGAAGGLSPRYLRRGDGAALAYELRSSGNGAAFGTLTTLFLPVPMILGKGTITVPVYGDVTSASVGVGTGPYQSLFAGPADIQLTYGVASCLAGGSAVAVADFAVSAQVVASCEVDATSLDFGYIPADLANGATAEAAINVRCTEATAYRVFLDNGNSPSATGPTARQLQNGPFTLRYGLFMDAGHGLPWGDTVATSPAGTGSGSNQALRVYGMIFAGQPARTGIYRDSVVVTVAY